jgi:hypothetical protein
MINPSSFTDQHSKHHFQGQLPQPESGLNTIASNGDFFIKGRTFSNDNVFSSPKGLAFLTEDNATYDLLDDNEELEIHIHSSDPDIATAAAS